MTVIRLMDEKDWPATWAIIEPVFRAGDTYSFDRNLSEKDAYRIWVTQPSATFVAEAAKGGIAGTYYIRPNQPGPGAHVCNCGYIVDEQARGMGVASAMCRHSLAEARARGFRAMQFNSVVSTNVGAIRIWERHGFEIASVLPGAFHHPTQGYVDVFIMYRQIDT